MFGIGLSEIILIFIVALIVLGPKRLPELAKTLGKFYREIKSTMDEVKSVVEEDIYKQPPLPHHTDNLAKKKDTWEEEFDKEIKKEDYQPKREKISFKKKEEENKENT